MSTIQNEMLLENLFEEALEELTILQYPQWNEDKIQSEAEILTYKRFEDLAQ